MERDKCAASRRNALRYTTFHSTVATSKTSMETELSVLGTRRCNIKLLSLNAKSVPGAQLPCAHGILGSLWVGCDYYLGTPYSCAPSMTVASRGDMDENIL